MEIAVCLPEDALIVIAEGVVRRIGGILGRWLLHQTSLVVESSRENLTWLVRVHLGWIHLRVEVGRNREVRRRLGIIRRQPLGGMMVMGSMRLRGIRIHQVQRCVRHLIRPRGSGLLVRLLVVRLLRLCVLSISENRHQRSALVLTFTVGRGHVLRLYIEKALEFARGSLQSLYRGSRYVRVRRSLGLGADVVLRGRLFE